MALREIAPEGHDVEGGIDAGALVKIGLHRPEIDNQPPCRAIRFAFLTDLAQQRLPVFTLSWVADYADPSAFLDALFHSGSPDNYLGYHNPEVDDLLDRARAEQNREERIRLYREAQQRILDDGVVIPLYHDVEYWLVAPAVHGLQVTPLGVLGLETVWLSR